MTDQGFATGSNFTSDPDLVVSVSEDRQAFTAIASNMEVIVGQELPATIQARLLLLAVPLEGDVIGGTEIALRVSGNAFVTEGATGLAMITLNGRATTEYLSPVLDNEFVYELRVDGTGASECRVSVCLVAEREGNRPDAISRFNVLSIDAEILRERPS